MKIAIPTKNNQVDDHFGHCDYFTVVTVEDNKVISSEKVDSGNSCGCKSNIVNTLKEQGVDTMLAGNMGQGAFNKINASQIKVVRGCSGEIDTVLSEYLAGNIKDQLIMCAPNDHENGHECSHN